jgi:capsular polysaccharide biosynthesis protein
MPNFVKDWVDIINPELPVYKVQNNNKTVKIKNLVCLEYRNFHFRNPTATLEEIEWIKQYVPRKVNEASVNNYYVSRKLVGYRYIINPELIFENIVLNNIHAVTFEELSLMDEINYMTSAKFIIGPHGAGLTSIVFANNAHLIELTDQHRNLDFKILCRALNVDYSRIIVDYDGENYTVRSEHIDEINKIIENHST